MVPLVSCLDNDTFFRICIIGKPLRNPSEGLTSIDPGKLFAMCAHVVACPKDKIGMNLDVASDVIP